MKKRAILVSGLVLSFILLGLIFYLLNLKYCRAVESKIVIDRVGSMEPPEHITRFIEPPHVTYLWGKKEAKDGNLIFEHKRFRQYNGKEPVVMEPNEKYFVTIYTDDYDINCAPKYWEEFRLEFKKPYEKLPESVRFFLDNFGPNDVGKTVSEVYPPLKGLMHIFQVTDNNLITYEPLEVRILQFSQDKCSFKLASEPFSLSMVKGITSSDRKIIYAEIFKGERIYIGLVDLFSIATKKLQERGIIIN